MRAAVLTLLVAITSCMPTATGPLPPPSVDEARALLDEIVAAALDRDFTRLCANASGTCEEELERFEDLAPSRPPRIAAVTVHHPVGDEEEWTSGGVLFVLCGTDAAGESYESEVLVFDAGDRLLATAAVFWIGTRVVMTAPGQPVDVGGPSPAATRCP